jgi:hypothetical protein
MATSFFGLGEGVGASRRGSVASSFTPHEGLTEAQQDEQRTAAAVEALLLDSNTLTIPPRVEWENCCVPLELLLLRCSVTLRRRRNFRGLFGYLVFLILLLALVSTGFAEQDNNWLAYFQLLQSQLVSTVQVASYPEVQRLTVPTASPTRTPTGAPTGVPTSTPSTAPTTGLPTGAPSSATPTTTTRQASTGVPSSGAPSTTGSPSSTTSTPSAATAKPTSAAPTAKPSTGKPNSAGRLLRLASPVSSSSSSRAAPWSWQGREALLRPRGLQQGGCASQDPGNWLPENRSLMLDPVPVVTGMTQVPFYYNSLLLFKLCQPGDRSGVCRAGSGSLTTYRAFSRVGLPAPNSGQQSCLALPGSALPGFPLYPIMCQTVVASAEEDDGSSSCFNGNLAGSPSQALSEAWTKGASENGVNPSVSLNECSFVTSWHGVVCELPSSPYGVIPVPVNTSASGFSARLAALQNVSSYQRVNEAIFTTRGGAPAVNWTFLDLDTLAVTATFVVRNDATGVVSFVSNSFQTALGGGVQQLVSVHTAPALEYSLHLKSVKLVSVVLLATFVCVTLVKVLLPLARMCCATGSPHDPSRRRDRLQYYLHFALDLWQLYDLVLSALAVYVIALAAQSASAENQLNALFDDSSQLACATKSFIALRMRATQVLGFSLFMFCMRLLKYLGAVGIVDTLPMFLRGLALFVPFALISAVIMVAVALASQGVSFGETYTYVLAMFVDNGGGSVIESSFNVASLKRNGPGHHATMLPFSRVLASPGVVLYRFFVVLPTVAGAIGAFYFSLTRVDASSAKRRAQRAAEQRASKSQLALWRLRTDDKAVGALTGMETRLDTVLSSEETEAMLRDYHAAAGRRRLTCSKRCARTARRARKGCANWGRDTLLFLCGQSAPLAVTVSAEAQEGNGDQGGASGRGSASARADVLYSRVPLSQALLGLQLYASQRANQYKVFITYEEIRQVVAQSAVRGVSAEPAAPVSPEFVKDIMAYAGAVNVYPLAVMRKYDSEVLQQRTDAEVVHLPSPAEIALRERRTTPEGSEGSAPADVVLGSDAEAMLAGLQAVQTRVRKVEDNVTIALGLLNLEYDRMQTQQVRILAQLADSLTRVQDLRARLYHQAEEEEREGQLELVDTNAWTAL